MMGGTGGPRGGRPAGINLRILPALWLVVTGCSSGGSSGPSGSSISGPGGDPAAAHLPDIPLPPPDPESVSWFGAPGHGLAISRRELSIVLASDVTVGQANDLIQSLKAEIAGSRPHARLLLLRLPDAPTPGPILAAWQRLLKDRRVAAAMVEDAVLYPERLPPDHTDHRDSTIWVWDLPDRAGSLASSGGNWALERARLPQLWNLRDHLGRSGRLPPAVAVIDGGFAPRHEALEGFSAPVDNPGSPHDHGTMVSGIIGAAWSDASKVVGASPVPLEVRPFINPGLEAQFRREPGEVPLFTSRVLDLLLEIVNDADKQDIQLVNNSYGMSQIYCPPDPDACLHPENYTVSWREYLVVDFTVSWSVYMDLWGDVYKAAIDSALAAASGRKIVFVSSSGNCGSRSSNSLDPMRSGYQCSKNHVPPGYVYNARDNSPLNNLAMRYPETNYVTVGSIDWENARSEFSNWPDTIAAGGDLVRSTEDPADSNGGDGYKTDVGTSFAAPLVAGAAAVLWTLDPTLTPAELIHQMVSTAGRFMEGSDEIRSLDAFAAASSLDTLRHRRDIQIALADIDDGTLAGGGTADGNLRWSVAEPGCEAHSPAMSALCEARAAPPVRGDGNIDIRDFRVLRDALLQTAGTALDGFEQNPRKDLNQDSCVTLGATPRPVPGSNAHCSDSALGDAPAENIYPRADLNGDGMVSSAPPAGGGPTDLAVLQAVWGQGPGPITFGLPADKLDGLLQSGDVHLDLADLATMGADAATIKVPGLPAAIEIKDFGHESTVLTTPAGGKLDIEIRLKRAGQEIACVRAPVDAPGPGQDIVARPNQSCVTPEFWLENQHANILPSPCLNATALCNCPGSQVTTDANSAPPLPGVPNACQDTPTGARLAPTTYSASAAIGGGTATSTLEIASAPTSTGTEFTLRYATECATAPDGNAHTFDQIAVRLATSLSMADARRYQVTVTCNAAALGDDAAIASFEGPGKCIIRPGMPTTVADQITGNAADGTGAAFNAGCTSNSSVMDPAHLAKVTATIKILVEPGP